MREKIVAAFSVSEQNTQLTARIQELEAQVSQFEGQRRPSPISNPIPGRELRGRSSIINPSNRARSHSNPNTHSDTNYPVTFDQRGLFSINLSSPAPTDPNYTEILKQRVELLLRVITDMNLMIHQKNHEIEISRNQIPHYEQRNAQQNEQIRFLETKLDATKAENNRLTDQMAAMDATFVQQCTEIARLNAEIASLRTQTFGEEELRAITSRQIASASPWNGEWLRRSVNS